MNWMILFLSIISMIPIRFIIAIFVNKWCCFISIWILCFLFTNIFFLLCYIKYIFVINLVIHINTTYLDFAILIWITGTGFFFLYKILMLAQNFLSQNIVFIFSYLIFAVFRFVDVINFMDICYGLLILFQNNFLLHFS